MLHRPTHTSYSLYFDGGDMAADEVEFVLAMAAFQKRFKRRYPTWREVLHVARCLGYRKVAEPLPFDHPFAPGVPADADPRADAESQCEREFLARLAAEQRAADPPA